MSQQQPLRRKHIPKRTCVACREKHEKRHLTRLVYADGTLKIDETGKHTGRGAYLCDGATCWQRAAKTNLLDRALRADLSGVDKQALLERLSS